MLKTFYMVDRGGRKGRYAVSTHDGVSTNKDGSPFWGMRIFSNKKDVAKYLLELRDAGYAKRGL